MCDYSLANLASRPAVVGEKLITTQFNCSTKGFAAPGASTVAVCVLPGTEVAFDEEITSVRSLLGIEGMEKTILGPTRHGYKTAVFAQVNMDNALTHHDSLEFPDGSTVLLTNLIPGQHAIVLQLPAEKQPAKETPVSETQANQPPETPYPGPYGTDENGVPRREPQVVG
jgi:hypothetical protein